LQISPKGDAQNVQLHYQTRKARKNGNRDFDINTCSPISASNFIQSCPQDWGGKEKGNW
jgi:hypothetical protein